MLRLLDVKGALEALPVSPQARGELVLDVRDAVLPQNERAWRVQARDGRLSVRAETSRAAANRDKRPRLGTTAEMLAVLAAGAVSPVRAAETGLVEDVRGAAEVMEHWFRARPAFLMPMNGF
jgi:hypothetical protein